MEVFVKANQEGGNGASFLFALFIIGHWLGKVEVERLLEVC